VAHGAVDLRGAIGGGFARRAAEGLGEEVEDEVDQFCSDLDVGVQSGKLVSQALAVKVDVEETAAYLLLG
jgi:hypothetical protein